MANTFELIASVTVGAGGQASIDFTSIPNTYTDLSIKGSIRTNAAGAYDTTNCAFNSSTASFSGRYLEGNGAGASSGTASRLILTANGNGNTASTFANSEAYIPNYAGGTNKSYSVDYATEGNTTTQYAGFFAGLWSNTAAITSISLTPVTGTLFTQYSTAYLYGVKNA